MYIEDHLSQFYWDDPAPELEERITTIARDQQPYPKRPVSVFLVGENVGKTTPPASLEDTPRTLAIAPDRRG